MVLNEARVRPAMEEAKAKQLTGHGGDTGPGPAVGGRWLERVPGGCAHTRTAHLARERSANCPSISTPMGPEVQQLAVAGAAGVREAVTNIAKLVHVALAHRARGADKGFCDRRPGSDEWRRTTA